MTNKVSHRDLAPLITFLLHQHGRKHSYLFAPSSTEAEFLGMHMVGQNKFAFPSS